MENELDKLSKFSELDFSKATNKEIISRITERQKKLASVSRELKQHFVGIDKQIDALVSSVGIWYECPELLSRPVIVCLYGPTGVGKTDLIRRLVKLLDFHDRFCEVELMNKGGATSSQYHSTISSVLSSNPKIQSGKPAIILLDEIQNFRTLNEDGRELPEYKFRDIWMLLSDGKLPFHVDLDYIMQLLWDYNEAEKRANEKPDPNNPSKKVQVTFKNLKMPSRLKIDDEDDMSLEDDLEDDIDEDTIVLDDIDLGDDDVDAYDRMSRNDYYSLSHFKNILRLDAPIEEIAQWPVSKKRAVIMERLNDPNLYEQADYTKCLIFISGNIDEAYRFAKKTDEVDVDADIFHKKSLKINILNIKKALMTRFRPEQIARFGNTQIIYPTLSKKSYQVIIQRKIKEIVKSVKSKFKVDVDVDASIHNLIYKNGVFPTQGTRPLFTTITEILEGRMPQFLLKALVSAAKSVSIYYEKDKICARVGKEIVGVPYKGSLDKLRSDKSKNLDEKVLHSVHEAGHAIVYAALLKISPPQISSLPASGDIGGFIWTHEVSGSKQQLEDRICITMSGNVAERLVFGDDGATWGLQEDIMEATNLAGSMVKKYGMDKFASYRVFPARTDIPNTDIDSANPIIEEIIRKGNEKAKTLLTTYNNLFKEVIDYLMNNEQLESSVFKKICSKHGLKITVKNSEETIYSKFLAKYNNFKKT